ncbi:hypothetical protein BaRGS_00006906 [Batillaria attramentaria]|uniref:Uncharacterized protein n=1 Tax=Batillaria attramentaria TaxID=370345 RepID=A0ABD0LQN6_9CAEN
MRSPHNFACSTVESFFNLFQLKDFLKKCKVANYCKQLKQIVEKAEETAKVITARRRTAAFNLADTKAVDQWEARSKEEGTPLSKFYASWRKLRDRELQQDIAKKDQVSGAAEDLPQIIRRQEPRTATEEDKREFLPKGEKEAAMKRKHGADLDSDEEDYSDFDSDELEQLARSASENDSSDSEEEEARPPQKPSKRTSSVKISPTTAQGKRAKMDMDDDLEDIVEEFEMSD